MDSASKQIVLIGYGAMARTVVEHLPEGVTLAGIVLPATSHPALRAEPADESRTAATPLVAEIDALTIRPDLVLECAGHAALHEHGAAVLARGWPLAIASVGALADAALYLRLQTSAKRSSARIHLLSGALAGMDGLAAAREGGLEEVTYLARKHPRSWRGSPAERMIDLERVHEPTVFFEGNAGQAALRFPANANVAATVALHGIGMQATKVRLMADPHTQRNSHHVHARGAFGEMRIELSGEPLPRNPRTSMLAALSAVRVCRQLLEPA